MALSKFSWPLFKGLGVLLIAIVLFLILLISNKQNLQNLLKMLKNLSKNNIYCSYFITTYIYCNNYPKEPQIRFDAKDLHTSQIALFVHV